MKLLFLVMITALTHYGCGIEGLLGEEEETEGFEPPMPLFDAAIFDGNVGEDDMGDALWWMAGTEDFHNNAPEVVDSSQKTEGDTCFDNIFAAVPIKAKSNTAFVDKATLDFSSCLAKDDEEDEPTRQLFSSG